MLRTLEQHLATWIKAELDLLVQDSALFPAVKVAAGFDAPQAGNGEVAVQVTATGLAPVPENRDLGPSPVTHGDLLRARVSLRLRFSGETDTLQPAPGAELQQVDLVLLAILARLRQRPLPGPDGDTRPGGALGAAEAVAGTRRAGLAWHELHPGDATVEEQGNTRTWVLPATALVTFRLSPRPLEGGRILSITVKRNEEEGVAAYAPAERLPLDYFRDLPADLLTELAGHGLTTMGDIGELGAAGVALLTPELTQADAAAIQMLADMAGVAALRRGALPLLFAIDPEMLALPASCLLTPTPAEQEVLDRTMTRPEIQLQVASLGLPVAVYLRPAQRAVVRLGHLLAREGR